MSRTLTIVERLEKYSIPEPNSGCFLWIGAVDDDGYGIFKRPGLPGHGRAHRAAYELAYGPIPDGLGVLHRCDNPPCVNPRHLFTGTSVDNKADAVAKRRHAHGETQWNARLVRADVFAIRAALLAGASTRSLAARYGTSRSLICHVKQGRSWAHTKED